MRVALLADLHGNLPEGRAASLSWPTGQGAGSPTWEGGRQLPFPPPWGREGVGGWERSGPGRVREAGKDGACLRPT